MTNNAQVTIGVPAHEYLNTTTEKTAVASTTIGVPDHEYLNTTTEKTALGSTTIPKENPAPGKSIAVILGLVLFILGSILPIIQLYIGRRYADDCPVNWHIPHYLVVAGAVGLVAAVLVAINTALALKTAADTAQRTPKAGPISARFCLTSLLWILLLFLAIWFIFGCYWVFSSRGIVQHFDPSQGDYCHPVLYRFVFWLLLIALIFKILTCCQLNWKSPLSVQQFKNARATKITTEI